MTKLLTYVTRQKMIIADSGNIERISILNTSAATQEMSRRKDQVGV